MGSVLLGAMAGGMAAVIALFLGAGFWPAFMTYVVTGFATMCGVVVAAILRPETEVEFADFVYTGAQEDAMSQWINDPETQAQNDDDQSNVA